MRPPAHVSGSTTSQRKAKGAGRITNCDINNCDEIANFSGKPGNVLRISNSVAVSRKLQEEAQRTPTSRHHLRQHALLLVAKGITCPKVAELLGVATGSVENWVRRFEHEGLAGLQEKKRPGRSSRLNSQQLVEVHEVLRSVPRLAGMSGDSWVGKTLSEWIESRYAVHLGIRQCQRLIRQPESTLRLPPPRVPEEHRERKKGHTRAHRP